jgi:tetratricopeptide (TPR) repeat protein
MTRRVALVLLALAGSARADKFEKEWSAGQDAFNLARYDDALAHFARARELRPRLPGPYRWLGRIARVQEKWDECVAQATTAVRLKPDSPLVREVREDLDACRSALGRPRYDRPLSAGQGALAVLADVEGASVLVDGIAKGTTPLGAMPLNKGRHRVEVRRPMQDGAYDVARAEVDVIQGITVDAVVKLAPR